MKRPQDSNYYELLEISQNATPQEIEAAYSLARKTYKDKNLSTRSLFSEEERQWLWQKMDEAYQVLSDLDRRKSYDIFLEKGSDSPNPWVPGRKKEDCEMPFIPEEVNGQFLKNLRETKGTTLQNMVSQTRIAINYLIAIEGDQFKNFPPEVYLKSYLNEYAKYLKVDASKLTPAYMRHYHAHQIKKK
ncbi:MAG: helix-turn-helix domain-containing protein [Nitrospirae bacterium]|nr:helix-turn-helix domain-containing protein [Nitrospirota bacterium]